MLATGQSAWPYLAPDVPLSPQDAALAAVEARTRLRARREVLVSAAQVSKTTALAALDELEAALVGIHVNSLKNSH